MTFDKNNEDTKADNEPSPWAEGSKLTFTQLGAL